MTTTELSPIQAAANELNAANTALDEIDRETARITQKRNAAQERATNARKTYDRLVSQMRSADISAKAHAR